ncbi:hypothetical protein ACQEVY_22120 [Streptomyces sp. CA-288835]|uniref:hypothetical protein n=1 Tax=Streptomyces sp. CA-288835 TaxID=3240069 RepID=UPI003D89C8D0
MPDRTSISLVKASDSPRSSRFGRRAVVAGTAAGTVLLIALTLFIWEPWVDRSPFTARVHSAMASARFEDLGGGSCYPKNAGKKVELFGEDKQRLAVSQEPSRGEILTSEYGDVAGYCFAYVEFKNVPGGEDTYYLKSEDKLYSADGKSVGLQEVAEESLRQSPTEAKDGWIKFHAPDE